MSTTKKRSLPRQGPGNTSAGISRKKEKRKGSSTNNVIEEEEDTATPEGKMMAQALSTFLPSEQTRFEAFRRSRFRADAVSTFTSSCLMDASSRQYTQREKTRQYLGAADYGVASTNRTILALGRDPITMYRNRRGQGEELVGNKEDARSTHPDLGDLVAPGRSQEITLIVSTLAKMYAQKMIQSARALATVEGYHNDAKILPRHLLEAHRHRVRAGVDPGFFMQSTTKGSGAVGGNITGGSMTASSAAALGQPDRFSLTFEVARAAQEAYDKSSEMPKVNLKAKESSIPDNKK